MSQAAHLPPPYQAVGKHALMPTTSHDEAARFNFLANLNRYLSTQVLPGVQLSYEKRAKPAFVEQVGRPPENRHEVRKLMATEPIFQTWSALRRSTMELRQQAGRSVVLRQLPVLNARACNANDGAVTLQLDPALALPRYVSAVDNHCMPGGYVEELAPDDVGAAANYDVGIFATTGGALGRYADGGGRAVVDWLTHHAPDFRPQRILDMGCGLGHNLLPLAAAFPDAEIVGIDVAAPMLRYGHARAQSLGYHKVRFMQASAESVPEPDQSFDLVLTCMMLHETSRTAIRAIFGETYRLLRPDGLTLSLEQPQYHGMDVYEQFIRDWDAFYNNEPFWTTMHEMDLVALATAVGFARERCFETVAAAPPDPALRNIAAGDAPEDYGRKAAWYTFGARR